MFKSYKLLKKKKKRVYALRKVSPEMEFGFLKMH